MVDILATKVFYLEALSGTFWWVPLLVRGTCVLL